ncbi:Y4yA family PLP-dependent enzyme [Mariniblastus fucicola]|uniref:Diaminopimelate decarboxylase n=1 Tax=Mariniblastus fucicola TaxID=980251 RepID=A0A5B9PC20_9BACT|nr:Y4yA family PLP-dependent enzyme [Mariniblastus fucicola]QEG23858.1 Diaminopimelate decarboxylase [Mariniblastus fucicola]
MSFATATENQLGEGTSKLRANCSGIVALSARLESWMTEALSNTPTEIVQSIEQFGSPLNVIATAPLVRNLRQLESVAAERDLPFKVFFARKSNKCLAFVDAAHQAGGGVDVASEQECRQALDRGVPGPDIICTAAIKTKALVELCVANQVTIAIDNRDELQRVREIAAASKATAEIAIRISGFVHDGEKLHSRFGFDVDEVQDLASSTLRSIDRKEVRVIGLHFHLDGYCSKQRVSAIRQCLPLVDHFRSVGLDVRFVDIGGGLPMSYLESEQQWNRFWREHRDALQSKRTELTYRNHGLGFLPVDGEVHGKRNTYPYWQNPVRAQWLQHVLDDSACAEQKADLEPNVPTIADALRDRSLQLRCEPGRSLLDGCGMTLARVEFVKQHHSGDHFVGVAMNRTQCRTGSDDYLVDPVVIRGQENDDQTQIEGYLVGAYCTESELISLRKLRFPNGIAAGDVIAIPNTAGYFMHFLESRSHQFPLAKNVLAENNSPLTWRLDEIDSEHAEK